MSGSVPIVAGPPREDYEAVAPKDSFIHVDDFDTLDKLAERINYLIDPANNEEYMKYHAWRGRSITDNGDKLEKATMHRFVLKRKSASNFLNS